MTKNTSILFRRGRKTALSAYERLQRFSEALEMPEKQGKKYRRRSARGNPKMKRSQFLKDLIKQLSPKLDSMTYVYCTVAQAKYGELEKLKPIVSIAELEGLTLVIPLEQAKAEGLDYYRIFRRITLKGHSSLEALGLTSVVTTLLAERGITTNVIAGFYHDHMFVPSDRADEAMEALQELANQPSG